MLHRRLSTRSLYGVLAYEIENICGADSFFVKRSLVCWASLLFRPKKKEKRRRRGKKKARKNKTAHPLQHSRIKLLLDFPRLNRYTLLSGTQLDVLKAPNPLLWNPPNAISSPNRLNVYDSLTFMLRVGEPSSFGALHPKGTEDATRTRKKG